VDKILDNAHLCAKLTSKTDWYLVETHIDKKTICPFCGEER
jgi:hypothetical protein